MKIRALLLATLLGGPTPRAADIDVSKLPPPAARTVDFAQDIRPLHEKLRKMPRPEKQKGGLRLEVVRFAENDGFRDRRVARRRFPNEPLFRRCRRPHGSQFSVGHHRRSHGD